MRPGRSGLPQRARQVVLAEQPAAHDAQRIGALAPFATVLALRMHADRQLAHLQRQPSVAIDRRVADGTSRHRDDDRFALSGGVIR